MNKNLAIIKDGVVLNCIVWNDENEFIPDEGYIAIFSEEAGPGWSYDETIFTQPEIIEIIEEEI
jgi:hypothetical protein